jgi:hypothetical protein
MCGRFTRNYTWAQIHAMYSLTSPASNLQPRFGAAIILFIYFQSFVFADVGTRLHHRLADGCDQ